MDINFLVVLGGYLTGGAALWNAWLNRNKPKADTAEMTKADIEASSVAVQTYLSLIEPLNKRIDAQDRRIDEQDKLIGTLQLQITERDRQIVGMQMLQQVHEDGLRRLAAQVISLGGQPVYSLPAATEKPKS